MQVQKGRTKSALLIWTKSDLSDKVFNRYFTIWPRFGTGYLRFGPIYSDLVIKETVSNADVDAEVKDARGSVMARIPPRRLDRVRSQVSASFEIFPLRLLLLSTSVSRSAFYTFTRQ